MGFMTGAGAFSESFGKAFSNSYGRTQEIKAQREKDERDLNDDVFKMTLKEQMDNKEALRKEKERDRGLIATGQAIADTYNGPADVAVKMLKDGADASVVKEFFAKGDFRRSDALSKTAPPTSGNNGNATGRNVDPQLPALDEDKAGATQDQMDSVFGPNGSVPSPTAPTVAPPLPTNDGPAAPVENDLGNGWIRTPKADPTKQVSLSDQLQASIAKDPTSEETKALAEKYKQYQSIIRVSEPEKADLDRDYQAAIDSEDPVRIANMEAKLQHYNDFTAKKTPHKADARQALEDAVDSGVPEAIAKARQNYQTISAVVDPEKTPKVTIGTILDDLKVKRAQEGDPEKQKVLDNAIIQGGNISRMADAPQKYDAEQAFRDDLHAAGLTAGDVLQAEAAFKQRVAPQTFDTDVDGIQRRALAGDPEATAQLPTIGAIKTASAPARVGRTVVDLQNDLTLAATPQERARIQSAIDAQADSESSAKVLTEGPKQGIWVDEQGVFKPGPVTPTRGEDGKVRWVGADGTAGARPFVKGEDDALKAYFKRGEDAEVKDQREKVGNLRSAYRTAETVDKLLTENKDLTAGGVGIVTKTVADLAGELSAARKLFKMEIQTNGEGNIDGGTMDALGKRLENINIEDIKTDADKRAVYNAQMAYMVYSAGSAIGQSGRDFSNTDQQLVRQMVGADASRGETAQQIMWNYLNDAAERVNDGSRMINDQAKTAFKSQWGWTPPQDIVPTADDLIEHSRARQSAVTQPTAPSTIKTPSGVTWRIK